MTRAWISMGLVAALVSGCGGSTSDSGGSSGSGGKGGTSATGGKGGSGAKGGSGGTTGGTGGTTGGSGGTTGGAGGSTGGIGGSTGGTGGGVAGAGGSTCGGFIGAQCPADQWCDFPNGGSSVCGGDDTSGTCQAKPGGCPADCPGVCGCDGQFYCNACVAHQAGIDDSNSTSCMPQDAGSGCVSDTECAPGLKCCYPCGIPGCQNACIQPDPSGQCPMFP